MTFELPVIFVIATCNGVFEIEAEHNAGNTYSIQFEFAAATRRNPRVKGAVMYLPSVHAMLLLVRISIPPNVPRFVACTNTPTKFLCPASSNA